MKVRPIRHFYIIEGESAQTAPRMINKCEACRLVNFLSATECERCGRKLRVVHDPAKRAESLVSTVTKRALICFLVLMIVLAGFYLSLIGSARSLTYDDKQTVKRAIEKLRETGFTEEVFYLENLAAFRASDNWLNASVAKENAYAATNFPFEIITLYSDFFAYPVDDTERAAILLHEAKHLTGADEREAYEFVWKHRAQLGWTFTEYAESPVWHNIRRQTKDNVPELFTCTDLAYFDCTEPRIR